MEDEPERKSVCRLEATGWYPAEQGDPSKDSQEFMSSNNSSELHQDRLRPLRLQPWRLGRENPDVALLYSLLPGIRCCPGVSPGGAQPTTSVLPSPAPSSKLPLAGLMPSALKEQGSQPSPCFYRLWKQEAKLRLCLGPGCQGLVDPPQGSPQAFLAAPLCSGHPTCPGPCDFDDCHSWMQQLSLQSKYM